ncbi:polyprenyl synthetase family protein [Lachnobacterium bovis]|uniref:polyprenyl synthetase family protein n=1 Tax=Lachnobacterium bovis TaxID=140626 RepID=UPI0003B6D1F9|nr:farnesyl diphosphate synthase [Lachnobacterium bovis]
MDFKGEIADKAAKITKKIELYLPKEEGFQKTIFSAMNYSVIVGGKRIRPMLMKAVYDMFEGTSEAIYPFMAAIEFIHTYSLVHDDLPAMDNDEYRRGQKTTHAKFGEAMGVLAGDALLNYAYEIALKAFEVDSSNKDAIIKALKVLTQKSGVYGMVGGQVVDVESEKTSNSVITREKLDFIYRLKTGALIEASMMIGAILANASDKDVDYIEKIASKIGLAFQIQDDILDVVSTFEELGKPIGSDEKNNKETYVTFEGIDKSKEDVQSITNEAIDLLHSFNKNDKFLEDLFVYLVYRNK